MIPNEKFNIFTIHFEPPKRGQPLYKEQYAWSQGVLYMAVQLYNCSTPVYTRHLTLLMINDVFIEYMIITLICW